MFNMDVNQTQLLELGLNALGFLVGGGIMMVLAAIFRRSKKISRHDLKKPQPIVAAKSDVPVESRQEDFQFINLSGSRPTEDKSSEPKSSLGLSRRNRTEVYQLARRMLEAHKSASQISDELGMSQAEISLLKTRADQDKGVENVER